MGIVEEAEGVQNIRDILRQVRGIGAIWAGPGDMSVSMGLRGQASHPAVQENLLRVLAACKEKHARAGRGAPPRRLLSPVSCAPREGGNDGVTQRSSYL